MFRDATKHLGAVVVLALAGGLVATSAATPQIDGAPATKTYVKDLIRVGSWYLPSQGRAFDVTPKDLSRWVATFAQMRSNGVRVHVPSGHTDDADKNRGWVTDMWVQGDVLMARIELIGDDAIAAGPRNEVSIYVPQSLTDGKGNTYDQPIAHVALTPVPVISGQGGWVPIAASRGASDQTTTTKTATRAALVLSRADHLRLGAGTMYKELATKLGLEGIDGMDDKALEAAIFAKIEEMTTHMAEMEASISGAGKTKDDAVKAAVAASRAPRAIDPLILKLAGENRALKLAQLVADAKITPAVCKALSAAFVDGASLSLSLAPDADRSFDATIAALGLNSAKELGTKTGVQTMALSRVAPGEADWTLPQTEITKMAARAYGK